GAGALARRARDAALEPAHRTGALANDQDSLPPALPQDLVEAVSSPDRDQVDHAASTRVDHVLVQELLAQIDRVLTQPEERDHLGDAVALGERAPEAGDLILRVAARGGE